MNKIQSKEQLRAAFALKVLENQSITNLSDDESKKFVNFCAGVPNMILQNGFGQTLAFLAAKGKLKNDDKHTILLYAILEWIGGEKIRDQDQVHRYLGELNQMEIPNYLKVQREVLALLEWIKRYAKAFIKYEEE